MRPFAGLVLIALPLSLGGCGLPVEFTLASYAADAGLLWFTDKSSNDHFLSMVAGQDCAMWRVVKGRPICSDHKPGAENPYDIDYDSPHREVGEGGHVAVYTASRQGGRLLTDQEAQVTLRAPSPTATAGTKPVTPAVATGNEPPAGRFTAELADTASPSPAEPIATAPRKPGVAARADTRRGKTAAADSSGRTTVRRPVQAATPRQATTPARDAGARERAATPTSSRPMAVGPSHSTAIAAVTPPVGGAPPEAVF